RAQNARSPRGIADDEAVMSLANVPALRSISGASRPRERRLDEGIDVAVEHARRIADLDAGTVVLHDRVRVEHVGPDLAAPVGRSHLAALLRLRRFLFAHALLEEPRFEDLHRCFTIL